MFGYGSQGHAHALNLRDSHVDVRVALPDGSASRARAAEARLIVLDPIEAAAWGDVLVVLTPTEVGDASTESSR